MILLSAFISGAKKAFFVLDRADVRTLEISGESPALGFLAQRPEKTLLTLLILHHTLWVLLIAGTVWAFENLYQRVFFLGLFSAVYLFAGRVLPRVLVQGRELLFLGRAAGLLRFAYGLAAPVRILLERVSAGLLRGGEGVEGPVIPDKDFMHLAPESRNGAEDYEREMIQNVMEFRETLVKEVMTPRPDMTCIELETDLSAVIRKVGTAGFSRIPIYEGDLDHIVGILYAKDLLPLVLRGIPPDARLTRGLLQPALHVPETKRVSELLREFKKQNVHIAMVVDEFGGVEGLVCLEDLLEEIVGEIQEEGDKEEQRVVQVDERTYRIPAMLSLDAFNDLFDVTIESEDYETIGGFVVDRLGHFPKWGEKIVYDGLEIAVNRAKGVRILELLVTRQDRGPGQGAAPESGD